MKVFNKSEGPWSSKVNFVDDNNVMLGYDMAQDCCEHADWFISNKVENQIIERTEDEPNLDGFNFDREFFQEVRNASEFEEGYMAVFRIVNGVDEKFIHIFNCHNGYYSHGFDFKIGNETMRYGNL